MHVQFQDRTQKQDLKALNPQPGNLNSALRALNLTSLNHSAPVTVRSVRFIPNINLSSSVLLQTKPY